MTQRVTMSTLQADSGVNGDYSSTDLDIKATFGNDALGLGFYVGVTGNVTITTLDGTDLLFTGLPVGASPQTPLFTHIKASGTDTTDLTVFVSTRRL